MVSIEGKKTRNTTSLTFTMAKPFRKRFCGAFSQSLKVSKQVKDHAKPTTVSDWADGEHKPKNTRYKFTYLHNGSAIS